MSDYRKNLTDLRRPSILMSAVRHGLPAYQRGRMLKRLTPGDTSPLRTLPRLIEAEAVLEETRLRGDANYSIPRHIEVLVALVAEAQMLHNVVPLR